MGEWGGLLRCPDAAGPSFGICGGRRHCVPAKRHGPIRIPALADWGRSGSAPTAGLLPLSPNPGGIYTGGRRGQSAILALGFLAAGGRGHWDPEGLAAKLFQPGGGYFDPGELHPGSENNYIFQQNYAPQTENTDGAGGSYFGVSPQPQDVETVTVNGMEGRLYSGEGYSELVLLGMLSIWM